MIAAAGHPHQPRRQDLATPPSSPAAWARPASAAPRSSTSTPRPGRSPRPAASIVNEGDVISIDGTTGAVYLGEVPVLPSPVVQYFEGELDPDADRRRRPGRGRAPADDARRRGAPAAGAGQRRHPRGRRAGPPVRRRGHRAVPHRAHVPRRAAPARRAADPGRGRRRARGRAGRAAAAAARGLRRDLRGDGRAAGHRPAARPAAARVPARPHRAVGRGRGRRGARRGRTRHDLRAARRPCTGCTSRTRCSACAACGSGWSSRACSRMQVRAIAEAAAERIKAGGDPRPEIMVPLVGAVQELELIREEAERVLRRGRRADRRRPRPPRSAR